MKNTLLINIGNTNTTLAYFKNNKFEFIKFLTSNLKKEKIDFSNINKSLICSVNINANKIIEKKLIKNKIDYTLLSHQDFSSLNLKNIKNKNEIGVDLLSQSNYISSIEKEAIIVSLGTASVIQCVKNKKIEGVIILPGIYESKKSLSSLININNINLKSTNNLLGTTTNESISIGILNSIDNFVNQLLIKYKKAKVFYTGGNSKYFKNKNNWEYVDNLEILGMTLLI